MVCKKKPWSMVQLNRIDRVMLLYLFYFTLKMSPSWSLVVCAMIPN
jgi:hypothetical protein